MNILYSMQGEKVRVWKCWTEGATVVVEHGQLDGKQTSKRYDAQAKNIGKANETTPEQQALLEADAKVVKQLKSGYFKTIEEAKSFKPFFPMKAQNYNDHSEKVKYPCYMQPKLDGQRLMVSPTDGPLSKQGERLQLPKHWKGVERLASMMGGLDGEVYAGLKNMGGLSLQSIISAFRKENEDTHMLKYYVYDIPFEGIPFRERVEILNVLSKSTLVPDCVVIVPSILVSSKEEADKVYEFFIEKGYEGVVYRNLDGEYEFDKRSYDLLKRKPRKDAEARIISVEIDKNEDGILNCELVNGEHKGNKFKCLMRKDADPELNYRKAINAVLLIGKTFTVEFEDYSDEGVPQKPVGKCLRAVDLNGNPIY